MEQLTGFIKKVVKIIAKPEMRILPGQLAFFFVLSLIPLVALLGAIASKFSISIAEIQDMMYTALPTSIYDILTMVITKNTLNFNIIVFFISAFILASNGTHSMIITSNEIYKIESRNYIKRRLKAIGMTFILVGVLFFIILIPIFGDSIFNTLKLHSDNEVLVNIVYTLYQILKYPVSVLVIYLNIKVLYILAPDKKIKSTTTTKGALFTTISWIISTEIYAFYVGRLARYDLFYGSISNIIILLLWIYILSYIFVLGMAFNAGMTREEDIERTGVINK
ncbi:MAG: YihY/virulence factor BrkB family protein [Firmicutes bacterium]|nr:YihY/virulence factor BrkB family protein [Bacillota bacterium]